MEEKTTMEITNDRLEEAIKDYAADRTKEKLTAVLNLLRPTKLLVPAMLKAPDQPTPCFLKSGAGEQYFVVYTSKEQMANAPKSQALLSMPFPACNSVAVKPELNLSGMVINPFTDNLVLKIELIQKLHEADEKMAKQPKQIKMTPQQFQAFVKNQTEFSVIPKRLYTEKAEFVQKLCDEKEAFVNELFAAAFKEPKLYPYTEDDYSVMALDISEDLTLIRVDLPDKGLVPPLCYRIYITYNPLKDEAHYYTIEMTKEKQSMHHKRDFSIFVDAFNREGTFSAKLRSMYAKELLKTGDEKDFAEALPIFRLIYDSGTDTDAQKEAACVLAHAYRIAGDTNRFFQMTLRDMLSTPCAEICLELGAYFEEAEDYEEASLWYYNAAHETSSILDVHTGGDLPLQGLIRCYEIMLAALPEDDPFAALTANQYEEALADAREALANWDVPEEL